MGKLGRLGLAPAERYERERPGELIHIDVKKLGRIQGGAGKRITGVKRSPHPRRRDAAGADRRIIGWEYVHIAIDDATRLAYAEILTDEKATPPSRSCGARSRSIPATASPPSAFSPTTAPPTARPSMPSPAARSGSVTCAPGRGARRPTARPSASSARCWPPGPTARSTAQAENAPPPLTAGSGTTTISADTKPSAEQHPSPA
jgi:hypothetical protein